MNFKDEQYPVKSSVAPVTNLGGGGVAAAVLLLVEGTLLLTFALLQLRVLSLYQSYQSVASSLQLLQQGGVVTFKIKSG